MSGLNHQLFPLPTALLLSSASVSGTHLETTSGREVDRDERHHPNRRRPARHLPRWHEEASNGERYLRRLAFPSTSKAFSCVMVGADLDFPASTNLSIFVGTGPGLGFKFSAGFTQAWYSSSTKWVQRQTPIAGSFVTGHLDALV